MLSLYFAGKQGLSTSAIVASLLLLLAVVPDLASGDPSLQLPAGETAGQSGPSSTSEQRHERGRAIYNFRCYYCHGYSGDAKTLAATMLSTPPRDFTAPEAAGLTRAAMIEVVSSGKPGTPMKSFSRLLTSEEVELVVDFVRREFIELGKVNTLYHTAGNGWPNHDRYRIAWPFATGEVAVDAEPDTLTPQQLAGRKLFLDSCISCHDRGRVVDEGEVWSAQAVSYPRNGFRPGDPLVPVDGTSGATPYAMHEVPPPLVGVSEDAYRGAELFQENCAFCHAADGTGKNWIGTFLQPPARDLTADPRMAGMTIARLRNVIENGLAGTSMPAWREVFNSGQIDDLIAYIDEVLHPLIDRSGKP
jgi:cytochrome c oxidase cbb3-type subunit 3